MAWKSVWEVVQQWMHSDNDCLCEGGWDVPRSSNQGWQLWLCRVHPHLETRQERRLIHPSAVISVKQRERESFLMLYAVFIIRLIQVALEWYNVFTWGSSVRLQFQKLIYAVCMFQYYSKVAVIPRLYVVLVHSVMILTWLGVNVSVKILTCACFTLFSK